MKLSSNIIMGAGLSGLACGFTLRNCLILEKNNFIGGLARTVEFKNFKFDLGGHRFFTKDPSLENFFKELIGPQIIRVKRKSQIYKNKKFIDYPLKLSSFIKFSPWQLAQICFTYLRRKTNLLPENSFKERSINRFGDWLFHFIFEDYSRKVWGREVGSLSPGLVDARLQDVSLFGFLKHIFSKNNSPASFSAEFLYPREGIGQLCHNLSQGLSIELGQEVTGLNFYRQRINKVIVNNSLEYACSNLVSTLPLTKLISFLDAPAEVKKAGLSLKYRGLICVFFILEEKNSAVTIGYIFPAQKNSAGSMNLKIGLII